jgi:hypothetical protein
MPHTVHLRRRLIHEYGETPGAMMLIDRAVAAYQDFARISGWTGNTALMVEAEFWARSANPRISGSSWDAPRRRGCADSGP